MFHTTHIFRMVAACVVAGSVGCQLPQHANQTCTTCSNPDASRVAPIFGGVCHHDQDVPTVQTGGQFARAQTFPINKNGLTLGEIVQQSLRDGVRPGATASVEIPKERTAVDLTPDQISEGAIPSVVDLADELDEIDESNATDAEKSEQKDEKLNTAAATIVQRMFGDQFPGDDDVKQQTVDSIEETLKNLTTEASDEIERVGFNNVDVASFKDQATTQIRAGLVGLENKLNTPSAAPTATADTTYYETAVTVTRKDGRVMVFPLWLVDRFQAGDVSMQDGDVVHVNHYNRTDLFKNSAGQSTGLGDLSNQIATDAAPLNGYIDLFRITHVDGNGVVEEYFVPRNTTGAYGRNPAYSYVFNRARVSSVDAISPENLDLADVIRTGRREAIARSARLLNPTAKSLEQRQSDLRDEIAKLPVVGDVCKFVESTTGLNSTDAIGNVRRSMNNVQNITGLPEMMR